MLVETRQGQGRVQQETKRERREARPQFVMLILAPFSLFWPSTTSAADFVKLGLLSLAVTGFFLFAAPYYFPGGAHHFTAYAQAIAEGTTLPPSVAQRDAGFPLLI